MNGALNETLADTLAYLMAVSRERLRPHEARARLRNVQAQHPDTAIDLVWVEQAYDASVHYDALLRSQEGSTVSLSFCPDRALPWPLRGAHRWSDRDLVRVNGNVLTVPRAIACLDFIWTETSIVNGLIDGCLIRDVVAREPIELTDDDLQLGMDAFRRAHRLHGAQDTEAWMRRRGLTHSQLEDLVADKLTIAGLRDRVTTGREESYFEHHRADFDTAQVAVIEFADEDNARRVCAKIRAGEMDFFAAAQDQFLAMDPRAGQMERPLFRTIRRGDAASELRSAVFAAAPGDLVGPVHLAAAFVLHRVLSIAPARLDEELRVAIKSALFEEWLAERRSAANIDWNWGTAKQTGEAEAR